MEHLKEFVSRAMLDRITMITMAAVDSMTVELKVKPMDGGAKLRSANLRLIADDNWKMMHVIWLVAKWKAKL